MNSDMFNPSSIPRITAQSQNAITNWLVAIETFHSTYIYLEQYTYQLISKNQVDWYLKSQITQLLENMYQELSVLANDLDSISIFFDLKAHTTRLNALIDQATSLKSSQLGRA